MHARLHVSLLTCDIYVTALQALSELIFRPAPGLVALMLSSSLAITPMAALSRPIAGVYVRLRTFDTSRSGVLIITLPGSPKGAKENLSSLLGVLPHAVELAQGGNNAGEKTHRDMGLPERAAAATTSAPAATGNETGSSSTQTAHVARTHGCGRDHGHEHGQRGHVAPVSRTMLSQDPSVAGELLPCYALTGQSADCSCVCVRYNRSVAARQRQSPYPLVPLRHALDLVLEHTPEPSATVTMTVDGSLVGHVLAEDIVADSPIPSGPSTNVDGYAVRCECLCHRF